MNFPYLIFTFFVVSCVDSYYLKQQNIVYKLHNSDSFNKAIDKSRYVRNKRDVSLSTNDDQTYKVEVKKDIIKDDKVVSLNAALNGLTPAGGYKQIEGDASYASRNGMLTLEGKHVKDEFSDIGGKGYYNIFQSSDQRLDGNGYFARSFNLKSGDDSSRYGGGLDFITSGGSKLSALYNHDSSIGSNIKADGLINLRTTENDIVNAKGSWLRSIPLDSSDITDAYGGSLHYLNRNGNTAYLGFDHVPDSTNTLSAAARFNLYRKDDHNLDATAKFIRTYPFETDSDSHSFNYYAGNLEYNYKDKLGLNLGVQHSDFNQRTDFSALGKMNIFKDDKSSVDLNAGITKTLPSSNDSPFQSNFGITFKKNF